MGPAHKRLRLLAARSWQYDRLLQAHNTDEPTPKQVKMLLESLGQPPKERSTERLQDLSASILEIAEPNDRVPGR